MSDKKTKFYPYSYFDVPSQTIGIKYLYILIVINNWPDSYVSRYLCTTGWTVNDAIFWCMISLCILHIIDISPCSK